MGGFQREMFVSIDGPPRGKAATLSPCGLYRYDLSRWWEGDGPWCNFVMLNPSTADAEGDDPTIRRCLGYARRWGYGGLVVTNLYAYRATDPKAMLAAADPIGPANDEAIMAHARRCALVVCGWGAHGSARGRGATVLRRLAEAGAVPHALRLTRAGQPVHPLYLPGSLSPLPIPMEGR